MTSPDAPDAARDALELVAGVSLRAPRPAYAVAGLSFGEASLRRRREYDATFAEVTLSLHDAAVEQCRQAGLYAEPTVRHALYVTPLEIERHADTRKGQSGLRALLVEHHLLAHPSLLRKGALPPGASPAAANALAAIQARYTHVMERGFTSGYATMCAECLGLWRDREQKRLDEARTKKRAELMAKLMKATASAEVTRLRMELQGINWQIGMAGVGPAPTAPCPHLAMFRVAVKAICDAHPEVAFELVGLLTADEGAGRFVLHPDVLVRAVGEWLVGRARDRYGFTGYEAGWYGAYWGRGRTSRTATRTFSARRVTASGEVPEGAQVALRFAATAWKSNEPVERLWRPPEREVPAVMPPLDAAALPDEALDVQRLVPAPSQPAAAPPSTTKATKKPAVSRKKK